MTSHIDGAGPRIGDAEQHGFETTHRRVFGRDSQKPIRTQCVGELAKPLRFTAWDNRAANGGPLVPIASARAGRPTRTNAPCREEIPR
jgi:hypothetical protein